MKCFYKGLNSEGCSLWSSSEKTWTMNKDTFEHDIIKFCRETLGTSYVDMWIEPLYFDDEYIAGTTTFFKECGIALYPKVSKVESRESFKNDEDYGTYINMTSHKDIRAAKMKGVTPTYVIIKGNRYTMDGKKYNEFIKDVRAVPQIKED